MPGGPRDAEARAAYGKAVAAGDAQGAPAIAGEAVGLIRRVEPAADIVARVMREAQEALGR